MNSSSIDPSARCAYTARRLSVESFFGGGDGAPATSATKPPALSSSWVRRLVSVSSPAERSLPVDASSQPDREAKSRRKPSSLGRACAELAYASAMLILTFRLSRSI